MGPHQRRRRTCRPAEVEVPVEPIGLIPDLFRQQADAVGELFQRSDEQFSRTTRSQLIVSPLTSEQRPGAPLAPALIWPAVWPLAVTVMVVAIPAGTKRGFHFPHCINHAQRVLDQR